MVNLGILGGMGPQASLHFISELIRQTPASFDQDHLPFVFVNACNVPDRTTAILAGNTQPVFDAIRPYLDHMIQCGVTAMVMPCNTVHCIYDDVVDYFKQQHANIHCYHMIDGVMRHAKQSGLSSVTLMATEGTIQTQLFHHHGHGVTINEPNKSDQRRISDLIAVRKSGWVDADHQKQFNELVAAFLKETDAVVLGCTELPLYVNQSHQRLLCPMQVQIQSILSDFLT